MSFILFYTNFSGLYGDVIAAVVLVVIEIVLGVIVLGELVVIVVVGGVVVVPGLEICAVGIIIVVRGVLVQEVLQLDIGFVVVCGRVVGGVVDGIEGLVVAVNDLGVAGIPASVVVGDVAVFVLHAAGGCGIVVLGFVSGILPGVVGTCYCII